MKKCFDSELYAKLQSENILKRIEKFDSKLYMEFGGKIFDDMHASRVLPGFEPNAKIKILERLKDKTEIIFIISAKDIEKNKKRADNDLPYSLDILRVIDKIRAMGITVSSILITLFEGQQSALNFKKMLEGRGENVYIHTRTRGYPNDVETICSDIGYGANPFIPTTRPLVVVAAPGPGSGKLATCLSQLYHEYKRGVRAGYAKFETFPIWNLPLLHPVQVAYEAATIDLKDKNMIDPFHLQAYKVEATNYNRDVEAFPLLQNLIKKITGRDDLYRSPTDMGVNMAGFAIIDDEGVQEACKQEIIRRYLNILCDFKRGQCDYESVELAQSLMRKVGAKVEDRLVAQNALIKQEKEGIPIVAIELENGEMVYGVENHIFTPCSACIINALKSFAGIDKNLHIINEAQVEDILQLKRNAFKQDISKLDADDVLTILATNKSASPIYKVLVDNIPKLSTLQAHSTYILPDKERVTLKKLGLNITSTAKYVDNKLFVE